MRRQQNSSEDRPSRQRPASTPKDRETQLIELADQLAEKQLRDGTASSQVITHYLKLGSSRERLDQEKLVLETKLVEAKIEQISTQQRTEEMFINAINAMKQYQGNSLPETPSEEYYD